MRSTQTPAIIEDYIVKALQRAEFEHLEDGFWTAWIPGFPGLIALGDGAKGCVLDVWRRVDEWIQASVEEGLELPVLDGIDLNCEENRRLLAQRKRRKRPKGRRFFENEEEFLRALDEDVAGAGLATAEDRMRPNS